MAQRSTWRSRVPADGAVLVVATLVVALTGVHVMNSVLAVRESRFYSGAEQRLEAERLARDVELHLELAQQLGADDRFGHDFGMEALAALRYAAQAGTGEEIDRVLRAGEAWREAIVAKAPPEQLLSDRQAFFDARVALAAHAAALLGDARRTTDASAQRSVVLGAGAAGLIVLIGATSIFFIRRAMGRLRERSDFERSRLDSVLVRLPVAVARFRGHDHVLELANPAFEALWPGRVHAGMTLDEMHPEFVAGGHAAILNTALREGRSAVATEVPWTVERAPGQVRAAWFNLTVEPVHDFGGAVGGVLAVAVDVTELVEARRRAEAQAERAAKLEAFAAALAGAATAQAIARTLVQHAPILFGASGCEFAQGPNDGVLTVVAAMGEGRPVGHVSALGEADPVSEAVRDGEASGCGAELRRRWPRLRESVRAGHAQLVRAGERIEGVLTLWFDRPRGLDADEQAALALLLRYSAQALQRAELLEAETRARALAERAVRQQEEAAGLIDAIFASAPVGLGVWDRELRYVRVNQALAAMDRVAAEAHLGRRPVEVVPPLERAEEMESRLRRVLETGEPAIGIETEIGGADQRSIWRQSWYPVRARGEIIALGSVVEDVTEHRRADAERARLVTVLEDAVRVRDEFLSIASHELKTPLTALDLHLRRLARSSHGWSEERRQHSLHAAVRSAERLARLVTNLLDVSQVGADRLMLELEPVELVDALREVAERFDEELVRSGSQLVLAAQGPIVGRWDRLRLDQIASNLLSNAIKFGAGKPIELQVEHDERHARLIVRDGGLGIAPEDQERVFRRFERAVSSRHFGGLGLGLWIARQSARALGGRILLSSTPGLGSSFAVELPLRGPAAEA